VTDYFVYDPRKRQFFDIGQFYMACLAANPTFAPNYLRMFRFLISMLFLSTALTASAQTDRFFPRNLQRAYDKGTS
jgi:hypothetical protein